MLEGKLDEPGHMLISQTVVEHDPLAPIGDEPQTPKEPKLVTHRRLAYAKRGRQVTDAQLPLCERPEDLQTASLPQGLKEIGEPFSFLGAQRRVLGGLNQLGVDDPTRAPIFPLPTQTAPRII